MTTHEPRIHGFRLHGLFDLVDGIGVSSQPLLLLLWLLHQMPLHVMWLLLVRRPRLKPLILVQAGVLVEVGVVADVRMETSSPKPHSGRVPRSVVVVVVHLSDSKPKKLNLT